MKILASILTLAGVLGGQALAVRPQITDRQVNDWMDLIVKAEVLQLDRVAPPPSLANIYGKAATRIQARPLRAWKGKTGASELTLYTWAEGDRPCQGITLEKGRVYLIWGKRSADQKEIYVDACRDLREASADRNHAVVHELDATYPGTKP